MGEVDVNDKEEGQDKLKEQQGKEGEGEEEKEEGET